MRITIHLPVTTYLYKFLEFKYGQDYKASEADWFGLLVINTLTRKSNFDYASQRPKCQAFYSITISFRKAEAAGFFITNRHGEQLAKAIDKLFREEIYINAIMNYENHGIEYKSSIEKMIRSMGISEDDLPYETIRKDFNRNKARILAKFNNQLKY